MHDRCWNLSGPWFRLRALLIQSRHLMSESHHNQVLGYAALVRLESELVVLVNYQLKISQIFLLLKGCLQILIS